MCPLQLNALNVTGVWLTALQNKEIYGLEYDETEQTPTQLISKSSTAKCHVYVLVVVH